MDTVDVKDQVVSMSGQEELDNVRIQLHQALSHSDVQFPLLSQLPKRPTTISPEYNFLFSTISPIMAVLFTNPFDTAKVRLQLQNSTFGPRVYRNSIDCLMKIARNEGLRGLQKGLVPAAWREGSKNVFRIGMFEPILNILHNREVDGAPPMWKRIVAAATSGGLGAVACNPFELIKTRLQAESKGNKAVAFEHSYTGTWSAFRTILRYEGVSGLYRGSSMSVLRAIVGSGANLPTYSVMREYVLTNQLLSDNSVTDIVCSMISSAVTAFVMNPVDVLRTRVYNQPVDANGNGLLYKSGLDCLRKVLSTEGFSALYKGFASSYMRLGPHFTLTFVFLEQMRRLRMEQSLKTYTSQREKTLYGILQQFDVDQNGRLDKEELTCLIHAMVPPPHSYFLSEQQYTDLVSHHVQQLLAAHGTDREGTIALERLYQVVDDVDALIRVHELRAAFSFFDSDGSGSISEEELKQAMKRLVPKDVKMSQDVYDKLVHKQVQRLFRYGDQDRSGGIDFEEFSRIAVDLKRIQAGTMLKRWAVEAGVAVD
eukprot:GILK01009567.1.p1 GENE.GILK01009567.1~~GILK01009567.1.p1  ORF type:complete len:540 (+),score=74.80 GILK01009567.1:82-1701(+)